MNMKMSILSQRSAQNTRPKSGGKIRPGIKVLTKAAAANTKAKAIYDKGVAMQKKFSDIEKEILEATNMKSSMYPKNVPYFSVAASDFGMPEVAKKIMDMYGEQRGTDSERRLYRFPVVFHSDDLSVVYPNAFKRYGGEPGYESHYADNGERRCRYLPEVTAQMIAEQKAKRIKRPPRREMQDRGPCDPNICPEYLQGQCKFRGALNFYIPGVPTSAPMVMETTSEYAAEAIYADLERYVDLYGGIPRSNPSDPQKQIFFITKVQEQRTYFDENGVKQKGLQWVPKLQADIDIAAVLQNHATLQVGHTAPAAWIAAPKGMPEAVLLPMPQQLAESALSPASSVTIPEEQPQAEAQETQQAGDPAGEKTDDDLLSDLVTMLATAGVDEATGSDYFDLKLGVDWKEGRESILRAIGIMSDFASSNAVGVGSIMGIAVKMTELELNQQDFGKYAVLKVGKGYRNDAKRLSELLDHLEELSQSGKQMAQQFIKSTIADSPQPATAA